MGGPPKMSEEEPVETPEVTSNPEEEGAEPVEEGAEHEGGVEEEAYDDEYDEEGYDEGEDYDDEGEDYDDEGYEEGYEEGGEDEEDIIDACANGTADLELLLDSEMFVSSLGSRLPDVVEHVKAQEY